MNVRTLCMLPLGTLALVGMFGVASCAANPQPAPQDPQKQVTPQPPEHGSPGRPHGGRDQAGHGPGTHWVGYLLRASLKDLELRADQRATIEGIGKNLRAKMAPIHVAHKELATALADGAAAGKIDRARVDPLVDKVVAAVDVSVVSTQEALNALHKTLDPAQRRQLIEGMRARAAQHGPPPGPHGSAEHGPPPGSPPHGPPGGPGRQRLGELEEQLHLTPDQVEQIHQKMQARAGTHPGPDHSKMREMADRMKAASDAFLTDSFDAKALGIGKELPEMTRIGTGAMIGFMETVTSVLTTPEQRTLFANTIRSRGGAPGEH